MNVLIIAGVFLRSFLRFLDERYAWDFARATTVRYRCLPRIDTGTIEEIIPFIRHIQPNVIILDGWSFRADADPNGEVAMLVGTMFRLRLEGEGPVSVAVIPECYRTDSLLHRALHEVNSVLPFTVYDQRQCNYPNIIYGCYMGILNESLGFHGGTVYPQIPLPNTGLLADRGIEQLLAALSPSNNGVHSGPPVRPAPNNDGPAAAEGRPTTSVVQSDACSSTHASFSPAGDFMPHWDRNFELFSVPISSPVNISSTDNSRSNTVASSPNLDLLLDMEMDQLISDLNFHS